METVFRFQGSGFRAQEEPNRDRDRNRDRCYLSCVSLPSVAWPADVAAGKERSDETVDWSRRTARAVLGRNHTRKRQVTSGKWQVVWSLISELGH